jgi:ATP citrate (pro-S)-lyase
MSSKGTPSAPRHLPPAYTHPLCETSIAIREYDAKLLLAYWLERAPNVDSSAKITTNFTFPSPKVAQISWDPQTNAITPDTQLPGWVFSSKLVAKPDQLIKRRGKAGLLALNKTWDEAKEWISARAGKPQKASDIFCTLHVCVGIP